VTEPVPIIFLSGLAADERLFEDQLAAFPNLRVQPWIKPFSNESIRSYAGRLAPLIDPGCPCIVGGASFGGVVALELANYLPVHGCILIGSIRSPSGLPWYWRMLRPVGELGPDIVCTAASILSRLGNPILSKKLSRRIRRLSRPETAFIRWGMCATVRWQPSIQARRVRIFQIHGSADKVLPVDNTVPHKIVPGGKHALSLFHPAAVNEFIASTMATVSEYATQYQNQPR
jgi:pimeloyl-ACP methyl ester carboxylesterase